LKTFRFWVCKEKIKIIVDFKKLRQVLKGLVQSEAHDVQKPSYHLPFHKMLAQKK
jgi:hypothetical protein